MGLKGEGGGWRGELFRVFRGKKNVTATGDTSHTRHTRARTQTLQTGVQLTFQNCCVLLCIVCVCLFVCYLHMTAVLKVKGTEEKDQTQRRQHKSCFSLSFCVVTLLSVLRKLFFYFRLLLGFSCLLVVVDSQFQRSKKKFPFLESVYSCKCFVPCQ